MSKDGTYWRWDGFCVKADAPDHHAQRLEQQNKLDDLLKKHPAIIKAKEDAQSALDKLLTKQSTLRETLNEARESAKTCETSLNEKRDAWNAVREEHTRIESEKSRLNETISLAAQDIKDVKATLQADKYALEALDSSADTDKEKQLETVRDSLNEARQSYSAAVRAYDLFVQEQNTRNARLQAIGDERVNLQNRSIRSRERIKDLDERTETLTEKLKTLDKRPDNFEADKAKLLSALSEIEEQRNQAAEKLAAAENEVAETDKALKDAERVLGESRESRAHSQALLSSMDEQREKLNASIVEKFDMKPEDLPQHSAIDPEKETGDLESLKSKKDKLIRERDSIGAVNLRAEEEAAELEKEVGGMLHERNDLIQAIEELRSGIQKINDEARERLVVAFEHVNAHFQRLFLRLFGGGKAHLALIESDDPLNSGLEIFAQPPGKALQSLSLLSGGEQTMASIALIFAMFLTNPSPICVLDEIDAPLDDANVDRVCDLLEEIAERGETRFVIITHHRLTMARMDRLYGVTMAEKGVSQLVSVDLQQSFDFLEEAA